MEMNLLSFSRYVPEGVVRLLANKGTVAHLGVQPRDVSVMFSDIVGFSTLAETLEPGVLIRLLAEYLEEMSSCVEASAGTVGEPPPPRPRVAGPGACLRARGWMRARASSGCIFSVFNVISESELARHAPCELSNRHWVSAC